MGRVFILEAPCHPITIFNTLREFFAPAGARRTGCRLIQELPDIGLQSRFSLLGGSFAAADFHGPSEPCL